MKLRNYQQAAFDAVDSMYEAGARSLLILLPTGTGKCLGRGTPVILYNGETIPVEDIQPGELLMGPDSAPRHVRTVCSGREMLYRITPVKGDPYVVNESHILSLKRTNDGITKWTKPGDIVNISILDYLASSKTFKHIHKGWRPSRIDFPERPCEPHIDPYFLGLWLGDGSSRNTAITSGDREIVEYVKSHAEAIGMTTRTEANSPGSVNIHTNGRYHTGRGGTLLMNHMRDYGLIENKHIPDGYKFGSRETRLYVLAGLIDTDGHCSHGLSYDLCLKSERLIDDAIFIARSLGFSAYKARCRKQCHNNGVIGDYFRCCISGELSEVPCRIARKKCGPRRNKKDVCRTGITVEPIGIGDYFGFELDGADRLFLLGDFTVTHNTVAFAHVAHAHGRDEKRVMVIAHRSELIYQAASKIKAVTGIEPEIEKAEMWASRSDNSAYASPFIVASVQTLVSGKDGKKRMHRFDPLQFNLLVIDECHHAAAATYQEVINHFRQNPDLRVLGVTATGDRGDGVGLGSAFEKIAYEYAFPDAVHDGWLVPVNQYYAEIEGMDFSKCATTAGDLNSGNLAEVMEFEKVLHPVAFATLEMALDLEPGTLKAFKDDESRHVKISELCEGRSPRKTLVFCASVRHAERLSEIFNRWIDKSSRSISGEADPVVRSETFADYKRGAFQILTNCMIATEGFDEPSIEIVAMAQPTKSRALYTQMLGRGTRPLDDLAHRLGDMETPADRRTAISQCPKTCLRVLDFVGNSGKHKLITSVDILVGTSDDLIVERAKELIAEGQEDVEEAIQDATIDVETERAALRAMAEHNADVEDRRDELELMAELARRANVVASAEYRLRDVSATDKHDVAPDLDSGITRGGASDKQIDLLVKFGWTREKASRLGKGQAGAIIDNEKKRRCTTGQAKYLRYLGHSDSDVAMMNYEAASRAIEASKAGAT